MVESILCLLAGLGIFVASITLFSETLETLMNERMRGKIRRATKSPLAAMNVGILVSAATGSSSATSSIAVGMVNNKLLEKRSATAIIIGANVGTTVTAQLIALEAFSISTLFSALAIVGAAIYVFSKKATLREAGKAVFYFSALFVGLRLINDAFGSYANDKSFIAIIDFLAGNNFMIFLTGLVFTAVLQGSSLVTGIVISLAGINLIGTEAAFYAVLGINLGAGMPVILSSTGFDLTAKQTAITNQVFNAMGILLVLPFMLLLPIDKWFDSLFPSRPTAIAMFHTIFNLVTSFALLPFVDSIIAISEKLLHGKRKKKPAPDGERT